MIDADRLAITRIRRQQGRCVACGTRCGRLVLCGICRPLYNYCPCCETTRPRTHRKVSSRCLACQQRYGKHLPRSRWLEQERAKRHPKLNTVIRLYRDGLTQAQMADALQMNRQTLAKIIYDARRKGYWPAHLKRTPGPKQKVST